MTNSIITWLEGKQECYWPTFENEGYSFYKKVKHFGVEYELGSGVYVPGISPTTRDIACIHCFYENPKTLKVADRFRAIIEIYLPPKTVTKLARENNIDIHDDFDIIQDGNTRMYNIAIESFLGKCHVVFGLANEDPEVTIQKYFKKHIEPTYICRLRLQKIGSQYHFKCVISNTNINNDIEILKTPPKKNGYKVTSLECGKDSVKLKLRRQSIGKAEENNKEFTIKSPTVLLERVNIVEMKNDIKSPVRQLFDISDNKKNTDSLKENIFNGISVLKNLSKNSRRKQAFTYKMYGSEVNDVTIYKEEISKTTDSTKKLRNTIDEEEDINVENMVNKMRTVLEVVTPQKSNGSRTPQRRKLTKLEEEIEEPVRKTPKKNKPLNIDEEIKNKKNTNSNQDIDLITNKMKTKLGIVTPQKTPKTYSTPTRRKLTELQEDNDDATKKVKKNETETPTQRRKSNRTHSSSKSVLLDFDSDEEILTPSNRRSAITNSTNVPECDDYEISEPASARKSLRMNLRNTPRKNYNLTDALNAEMTPKSTPKSARKCLKLTSESNYESPRLISKVSSARKNTPSRIKVSSLPTQVETRESEVSVGSNKFELARVQLRDIHLRSGCLPCREKEYEDITMFLQSKLEDRSGGCMYISGVPGTGKTATVREIMKMLSQTEHKNSFKYISVNALSLTEPKQVYVEIAKQMCNRTVHWDEAFTYIRSYFMEKKHLTHIFLIDELDKLYTRKQDVIYNLLDLPSTSKTALVVITIANTMDLPERLLSNKVNSRLGLTRLTFRPYKHKELTDIVRTRLSAHSRVFRSEAIEFIARKVAAVSGDARRALAICARATEIAELGGNKEITMDIVNKTLTDMVSSPKVQAIRYCSKAEKMVLQAISHEVTRTGNDEVSFSNIIQVIDELCILESITIPNTTQLLLACQRLNFFRLIITQEGRHDVANTLLLNISPDDIHYALKDD